jgi:hypothetical protein
MSGKKNPRIIPKYSKKTDNRVCELKKEVSMREKELIISAL